MRDFPATSTWPSGSRTGAVEKSLSARLSEAQLVGAKYWSSDKEGESSSTESLSS